MQNYVQKGDSITVAAPYALTVGAGCLVGIMFGVATNTVASGANTEIKTRGVLNISKDTSTFTDGAVAYWDNTNKVVTSTASGNTKIGVAVLLNPDGTSALGGASGDATVRVRLNGAF